jgi:D-xylose transport system substrate-binding protein
MGTARKSVALTGAVLSLGLVVSGCSSSTTTSTSTPSPSAHTSMAIPQISAAEFKSDFSTMKQLTGLTAQGKGLVGVLLPDTTTSTRYVQYDAPYLKQAFEAAGLPASDFKIDNAGGSASTMQTQAEADINAGASVLLVDPLDSGSGAAIESKAKAAGVKVIDYDRLVKGGPADRYYVSFDNTKVGALIGQGFVACTTAWKVAKPNVLIMNGDPTDNNATLFANGYHSVLDPKFTAGTFAKVSEPAGTWTPSVAATTFEQQFTAHPNINAAVTPNDDNANAVIAVLKKDNIPAKKFPTTGQDASLPGLQNILAGYQCGTVYKPIYLEAQAAAALALYLRAGATPPTTLANATTMDSVLKTAIKSVYTTPIWVTPANMASTVVKDGAVKVAALCTGNAATACTAAGIK